MERQAFCQAIMDEPDEDTARLVFADWLEDHGESDRAEWIRASCRLDALSWDDPGREKALRNEWEARDRCRPPWWEDIKGVSDHNDRGVIWLEAGSQAAVKRLGKTAWLPQALEEGWLAGINITWSDGAMAAFAAKWLKGALAVPLWVRPAPQISDEGLAFWLSVPILWGLELTSRSAEELSSEALGRRADLRVLALAELDGDIARRILAETGKLTGLRRLTIKGGDGPTEADLGGWSRLQSLRRLSLNRCDGLTDAGLLALAGLKGLKRLELSRCEGITDAGVARLQKASPSLKVEKS